MDSLSLSKRYEKCLDKMQQKEAEIPLHQMEAEQPHKKRRASASAASTAERSSRASFCKYE